MISNRHSLQTHEEYCETLRLEIGDLSSDIDNLQNSIDGVPAEIIDFTKIKQQHKQKRSQIISLRSENFEQEELLKSKMQNLIEVVNLIENYDINELIEQRDMIAQDKQELASYEAELRNINRTITAAIDKTKLLEGFPR